MKIADPENANEINRIMLRKGSLLVQLFCAFNLRGATSGTVCGEREKRNDTKVCHRKFYFIAHHQIH